MRFFKYTLFYTCVALCVSCEKENTIPTEDKPACYIQTFHDYGWQEPFNYTFNEAGYPDSFLLGWLNIYGQYTNGKITSVDIFYNESLLNQVEIDYSGIDLAKFTKSSPDNGKITEYHFKHQDNQISSIEFWVNYEGETILDDFYLSKTLTFQHSDGKLIKMIKDDIVDPDGGIIRDYIYNLESDDYNNPFYRNLLHLFYLEEFATFFSKNNITKYEVIKDDGQSNFTEYNYNYSEKDYPVILRSSMNGSEFAERFAFTYRCDD